MKFVRRFSMLERFEDKYIPEPNSGCWLWLGMVSSGGYGRVWDDSLGRNNTATHVAWRLYLDKTVPVGLCLCHKCDIRCCVNPDHLFVGTYKDNFDDMVSKGRFIHARGERIGGVKLSERIVRSVLLDPRPNTHIARELGVASSTIDRIKRGDSWTHVELPVEMHG